MGGVKVVDTVRRILGIHCTGENTTAYTVFALQHRFVHEFISLHLFYIRIIIAQKVKR